MSEFRFFYVFEKHGVQRSVGNFAGDVLNED